MRPLFAIMLIQDSNLITQSGQQISGGSALGLTKTLVVNCSLKLTANKLLADAVGKFSQVKVVHFSQINDGYQLGGDADAVVLSGSAARIVYAAHRKKYLAVAHLIESCNLPILGICFGHQLLCHTMGAAVGSLAQPVLDKFEQVHVTEADDLFEGMPSKLVLAEWHNDYVFKGSLSEADFILLADSPSCEVETVKHRSKPFYGVQFHPERTTIKGESSPDGSAVICNFFKNTVHR
jgi:GMP synthase-like glutamine amidotransferase